MVETNYEDIMRSWLSFSQHEEFKESRQETEQSDQGITITDPEEERRIMQ